MINRKIVLGIAVAVLLISTYTSYSYFADKGTGAILNPLSAYKIPTSNGNTSNATDAAANNEPKTEPCPLNGEMLTASDKAKWEKRRPLGIMVENHKDARPQSGLSSADIVYEAVAEGGITRFLTVFYCHDAPYVGPVRSARMYFIKLLEGYGTNPLYAHVGGANTPGPADALGYINNIDWGGYNDLNQFSVPFPAFWRDYERLPGVVTEHTVYTSTAKLWQYAKDKRGLTNVDDKGKAWNVGFTPWKFTDDAPMANRGSVNRIDFGFWTQFASDYSVTWSYSKERNSYLRTNGGAPHIDKNTGKQLEAKDVIVVFAKESPVNDGYPAGQHLLYGVIGSGNALVFQDGNAIKATWSKPTEESTMEFTDNKTGKEISMVRGKIFVEILPIGNTVTY